MTREPRAETRTLARLLDPVFGFFVWAAHLLVVYCTTAVVCALGAEPGSELATLMTAGEIGVTVLAVAMVAWHGWHAYRRDDEQPNRRFLDRLSVGNDAIAAVGITWVLLPILMVPACR